MKAEKSIKNFAGLTDKECRELITENVKFIEAACSKAVRYSNYNISDENKQVNEVLSLFNNVIDKLNRDNFKAIRSFKGRSKFTTYLSGIVSFSFVDLVRKKRGRGGKRSTVPPDTEGTAVRDGKLKPGGEMVVLSRSEDNPENSVAEEEMRGKKSDALKRIRQSISVEERLILSMRFPFDELRKPVGIREISLILGISQKALYKRLERLLVKCRKIIEGAGIEKQDIFPEKK